MRPQIAEARRQHKNKFDEFEIYQRIDLALKTIMIAAVDKAYIISLCDK